MEQDDTTQAEFETLLNFFKALSSENRLKIIGILANRDCTVQELAGELNLKIPTVSEHLATLKWMNLVSVRKDGTYRIYSFNADGLHGMVRDFFTRDKFAALVPKADDDDEAKILQNFFRGDELVAIPMPLKKRLVVLKYLANQFEEGVEYTEQEVNDILTRHHEDYATLRREMVDHRFMARQRGIYWKLPPDEATQLD
jgi:hypothetical protein